MFNTPQELAQALRDAIADPKIVPIHGPYTQELGNGVIGACPVGAIAIKAGINPEGINWEAGIPAFSLAVLRPGFSYHNTIFGCIITLWEVDGWSWEQLIAWLDSLRPEREQEHV